MFPLKKSPSENSLQMEKYFRLLIVFSLIAGCRQDPEELPAMNEELAGPEALMAKTWRYEDVVINFNESQTLSSVMEPTSFNSRSILNKRKVVYDKAGYYQLQWDNRGEYALGTLGDPNWQPSTGYWDILGDTLIHNKGQTFETKYYLEVGENAMTRTHLRYMSNWDSYATFTERFILDDQP